VVSPKRDRAVYVGRGTASRNLESSLRHAETLYNVPERRAGRGAPDASAQCRRSAAPRCQRKTPSAFSDRGISGVGIAMRRPGGRFLYTGCGSDRRTRRRSSLVTFNARSLATVGTHHCQSHYLVLDRARCIFCRCATLRSASDHSYQASIAFRRSPPREVFKSSPSLGRRYEELAQ
jgi:hypothetical protein